MSGITPEEVCEMLLQSVESQFAESMTKAALLKSIIKNGWCGEFLNMKYRDRISLASYIKLKEAEAEASATTPKSETPFLDLIRRNGSDDREV